MSEQKQAEWSVCPLCGQEPLSQELIAKEAWEASANSFQEGVYERNHPEGMDQPGYYQYQTFEQWWSKRK